MKMLIFRQPEDMHKENIGDCIVMKPHLIQRLKSCFSLTSCIAIIICGSVYTGYAYGMNSDTEKINPSLPENQVTLDDQNKIADSNKNENVAVDAEDAKSNLQEATPPEAFRIKGFTILGHHFDPDSSLNIWAVEHAATGEQTILYSTSNNAVFFTGSLWDGMKGNNISDIYYEILEQFPKKTNQTQAKKTQQEKNIRNSENKQISQSRTQTPSPGNISPAFSYLAQRAGVIYGDADSPTHRRIYIIFDPLCAYCKELIRISQKLPKEKNKAIVWLPVAALMDETKSKSTAAWILQSDNPLANLFALGNDLGKTAEPTAQTLGELNENMLTFAAVFKNNPNAGRPAVPVMLYHDPVTGPKMTLDALDGLPRIYKDM